MNQIIVIGYLGDSIAYLNIPKEEAIHRWMKSEGTNNPPSERNIRVIDFEDEFGVYEAWRTE